MEKDTITKTKDQSLEIPIIPKEENSYITPRINDPIAFKRVEEMNSFIDLIEIPDEHLDPMHLPYDSPINSKYELKDEFDCNIVPTKDMAQGLQAYL